MKTSTSGFTRGSYFGNVDHMLIILSEKELVALTLMPLKGIIKTYGGTGQTGGTVHLTHT